MPDFFDLGFFVREPAWHKMGVILDDYPGREEGMRLAGHNFELIERPVFIPAEIVGEEILTYAQVPNYKSLVKDMPNEVRPDGLTDAEWATQRTHGTVMNITSDSYGLVQNSVGWDIIDALVGEGVKYETAGTLKGGAVCWILAYLDEPYTAPGDNSVVLPYVNVAWSHDGSSAIKARPTSIRVVCWNTQSAAEAQGERNQNDFTFRHTKNVMEHIEDAKMAMTGIRAGHEVYIEMVEELVKVPVTKKQREIFVTEMVPMPAEALISERVKNNIEKDRTALRILFDGPTVPDDHRLTGYGLHLAGVEFLDHLRGFRSRDTLFGRQLLRDEPAKAKLRTLIHEVAKA